MADYIVRMPDKTDSRP